MAWRRRSRTIGPLLKCSQASSRCRRRWQRCRRPVVGALASPLAPLTPDPSLHLSPSIPVLLEHSKAAPCSTRCPPAAWLPRARRASSSRALRVVSLARASRPWRPRPRRRRRVRPCSEPRSMATRSNDGARFGFQQRAEESARARAKSERALRRGPPPSLSPQTPNADPSLAPP